MGRVRTYVYECVVKGVNVSGCMFNVYVLDQSMHACVCACMHVFEDV